MSEHFPGCHPEHAESEPDRPDTRQPDQSDACWHCGTVTPRGCNCAGCWDGADDIPPSAVYHCPTCKRWWAYMSLRVTTLTFGAQAEGGADAPA